MASQNERPASREHIYVPDERRPPRPKPQAKPEEVDFDRLMADLRREESRLMALSTRAAILHSDFASRILEHVAEEVAVARETERLARRWYDYAYAEKIVRERRARAKTV